MQGIHRILGEAKIMTPVVAANSEVFAEYSPVYINTDGFLAVISSSGEKVRGYCMEAFTANSANQTGTEFQMNDNTAARYAPPVLDPSNVEFWADGDAAFTETDRGAYCDAASESAGVVTLNLSATTSGQFEVVGLLADFDPNYSADTTKVIVRVAEPQGLGFTQD